MVISERKPMEEILGFLKGCEKIVLVGCGQCASACKVGGAPEIEAKWFETPVITKAQMENHDLMYVTHNTVIFSFRLSSMPQR